MSDVIIGPDGKPRCAWAGTGDSPSDTTTRFGALALTTNPLSPLAVPGRAELGDRVRETGRVSEGVSRFDVAKVARMTSRDVSRLVEDASIIRNRARIEAT